MNSTSDPLVEPRGWGHSREPKQQGPHPRWASPVRETEGAVCPGGNNRVGGVGVKDGFCLPWVIGRAALMR